ncbi:FUSC family protein [Frondihabitans australicus]|uniref:Fusaric acid resistance family protein n=1 Tax=Frondihabitans australicus TaxID=386892 RepID=A0A495ILC2_9MICO|nr:FUSC family protein [Frondihabitans australicus]RKR76520.1 fusaric acid resistance family protein [Frondihabitans australicus]
MALRFVRLRNETVELFRSSRAPVRLEMRWQFGIVSALVVLICCLALGPTAGAVSSFGAMVSQWQNGRPLLLRIRTMLLATAAMTASTALGVTGARLGWLVTPLLVAIILVMATLYYTFVQLQGPGPLTLFYGAAFGSYLGQSPAIGWHVVWVTALAGVLATILASLAALRDPHSPERLAIAQAREAVDTFESVRPYGQVVDTKILRAARAEAYQALDRAWITIHAARAGRRSTTMDTAMMVINRRLSAAVASSMKWPNPSKVESPPELQSRLTLGFRARHGFRLSSVAWFTAWRIGAAGLVAGLVSSAVGVGHPYWSILTSTIIVQVWMSRISVTRRAIARAISTVIGSLLFAGITLLGVPPWVEVGLLILFVILMNVTILANYALGVIFLTPMALLSSEIGNGLSGAAGLSLAGDRVVQTFIGAAVSLVVIWLTGLRIPKRVALDQFRRTVAAIEALLDSLSRTGRSATTMAHRSELQYELVTNGTAAARASEDDPALADWQRAERVMADLGYAALAACWLPKPALDAPVPEAADLLERGLADGDGILRDPDDAAEFLTRVRDTLSEFDEARTGAIRTVLPRRRQQEPPEPSAG